MSTAVARGDGRPCWILMITLKVNGASVKSSGILHFRFSRKLGSNISEDSGATQHHRANTSSGRLGFDLWKYPSSLYVYWGLIKQLLAAIFETLCQRLHNTDWNGKTRLRRLRKPRRFLSGRSGCTCVRRRVRASVSL